MAMQFGPYEARTRHRQLVIAVVKFTLAASAATVYTDKTGVLDATTPFTYAATGVNTLNLREDFDEIYAQVEVVSTTVDDAAQVSAISTTAGANTVALKMHAAGIADALVGEECRVVLFMSNSDDA